MKYIIANWKMKLSCQDETELARRLANTKIDETSIFVSIHPTFLAIHEIASILKDTPFHVGAQNCFFEDKGAYTGEISPKFLKQCGCEMVIVGHSERRTYIGESSTVINKKIHALINNGLIPILCVGENSEDRLAGNKDHIVRRQVELSLNNIHLVGSQKLLIAYEPVWAIGTGCAASISQISYMHQVILHTLLDIFPKSSVEKNTAIVYGGSVDGGNISELIDSPIVNGALVGGSSLNLNEFTDIIKKAQQI